MLRLPPLPTPPAPPPRTPFPLVAVVAPVIGAVAIALVTGSVFVLLFAVLSPIIAIATAWDARRHARRHRRDEAARFDRDCASWLARVPEAHAAERAAADAAHPRAIPPHGDEGGQGAPLRVGTAPAASRTLPEAHAAIDDPQHGARLGELVAAAATHPAMPVVVPPGAVRLVGRGRAVEAIARWIDLHPGCSVERASGRASEGAAAPQLEIVVESATRARLRRADGTETVFRPEGITRREHAEAIARRRASAATLPRAVAWSSLPAPRGSLPAAVGIDETGPVALDLLAESPHALVGGTTGSGKSEFLRTVAVAWAAAAPPAERSVLLVDFKGGSAFAELADLPHVVGLITDLDARGAERALRSLRAEVRRRERVLLERSARDIRDLPPGALARLLVLVDEYAVLVEAFPELHALFADLAARGRSLGVHLVLCTQRPSGVVRDAVAANCATRIAFRLASAADAAGLLPAAPPPDAAPSGRAVVVEGGRARSVQIATITAADIRGVAARWAGSAPPDRPWLPPLPVRVDRATARGLDDDPAADAGPPSGLRLAFGILDDPDHQRRCRAEWRPVQDGSLLVVGAHGSGSELALATLAESAESCGALVAVLPAALADALAVLDELRDELEAPEAARTIVVVADIDALVAEAGDRSPDLLDALDAVDRRARRAGGAVVASATSVVRARAGVVTRFDSVLLLRAASIDDHRAAGGAMVDFDPDSPVGRGRWRGRAVQVIAAESALPDARAPRVDDWAPSDDAPVAIVSRRPRACAELLRAHGLDVSLEPASLNASSAPAAAAPAPLEHPVHGSSRRRLRIAIADAESWQGAWAALAAARHEGAIVLADVDDAEGRAVLGHRARVPLRSDGAREIIVAEAGERPRRARWTALTPPPRAL